MTGRSAEFNGECNDIRLKIQIGEEKKQKEHLKEKIGKKFLRNFNKEKIYLKW